MKGGLLNFWADNIKPPASPRNNTSAEQTSISPSSPKPSSDVVTSSSSSSTSAVSPEKQQETLGKNIHQLKQDQQRLRNNRSALKSALNKIVEDHPDVAQTVKRFRRDESHRPSLEADETALHQTILEITTPYASADDRRRTETLCSI
ncbi:unnamed protein product, partial [Didymodactylos carnosus]